jgi:hypothetical protein
MQTIELGAFSSLNSYSLDVADEFNNLPPLHRPAAYVGDSLLAIATKQAKKGNSSRDFGPELSMRSAYLGRFRHASVGGKFSILQFVETTLPKNQRPDSIQSFHDARVVAADASAGILLGGYYARNYYHWMCQALPTLEYIKRTAHPECRVIIGQPYSWQLQSLEMAGIGPDRIDIIDDDIVRVYENLYFPLSDAGRNHGFRPGLDSFYGAMRPSNPHKDEMECVYISRREARGRYARPVRNEDALEHALAARGFSIVLLETLTLSQQIDQLRRAKLVVAPHGAGLANIVFCKEGTPVYELFPAHHIRSDFFKLAQYHNLQYHAECHKTAPDDPLGGWHVMLPRALERIDRLMAQI